MTADAAGNLVQREGEKMSETNTEHRGGQANPCGGVYTSGPLGAALVAQRHAVAYEMEHRANRFIDQLVAERDAALAKLTALSTVLDVDAVLARIKEDDGSFS